MQKFFYILMVKGESSENVISLEDYAFDDQYEGCEKAMEIKAEKLLAQEREMNSKFSEVWEKAEGKWENMTTNKNEKDRLFEIDVTAYTMEESKIYPTFNEAVKKCCKSMEAYMNNFHFKALHFYLTRAIQILRRSCTNVYRGITLRHHPNRTREMRFGQFASSSLEEDTARKLTNASGTLYNVYTCEGANITHLSVYSNETEVLIPPYEVFSVSRFSDSGGLKNVELHSTGKFSKFNCTYLEVLHNNAAVPGQLTTILFPGVLTLVLQTHFQTLTGL
ncbi:ecto-ADP-ribosyltransferase 5-like [Petaurus breviceps papuanus]|uniref:ecto-ADP-ribosyltransferase 5-like n=1 Tax=Petaurus breviceps papuanus TaxID=3040969 RepID=UPI0036D91A24